MVLKPGSTDLPLPVDGEVGASHCALTSRAKELFAHPLWGREGVTYWELTGPNVDLELWCEQIGPVFSRLFIWQG